MPKQQPGSMGEFLAEIKHKTEIDARQNSYAVATEIVKNVITRYGGHEPKEILAQWTAVADGVYDKIKGDMDAIFKE